MTNDPKLKGPAQKVVNFLVDAQHAAGGWRYAPGQEGDLSVTGWCVQALKAARTAKLVVPENTWKKAGDFVNSCEQNNGYSYTPNGGGATPTMTAVGLLSQYSLHNWGSNNPGLLNGIQNHFKPNAPGTLKNMYYYYYATQVLYQRGGEDWKTWNAKMTDVLLKSQTNDGSWTPAGTNADAGGRLMETSLSLLTLEVYYRYPPNWLTKKSD
jgi:hypothetical protein